MFPNDAIYCFRDISRYKALNPGLDAFIQCHTCLNSFRMSASDSYVGKYTKQKLLGKGTFGEAWLVVSTASGR